MRLSPRLFKMWLRNFEVWMTYWKSSLVGNLLDPLFMLLGFGMGLGQSVKEIEGMSYIQFMAPGIIASTAMYSSTFESTFSTYTRMGPQKTFESILMTPMAADDIIAGEVLWSATKGLESSFAIFMIMFLLPFNLTPSFWGLLVIPASLLIGLMFASMATVYTSYAPSYDFFSYYFTLVLTPQFLLSGIFFPMDNMPDWVAIIGEFMPLTHAVKITRSLTLGSLEPRLIYDVVWMVVASAIFFAIASRRMKKRLVQ